MIARVNINWHANLVIAAGKAQDQLALVRPVVHKADVAQYPHHAYDFLCKVARSLGLSDPL